MKSSTRIEVIDSHSVVSMPFGVPPIYIPHVTLIAFIAFAWAADGVFEVARWVMS